MKKWIVLLLVLVVWAGSLVYTYGLGAFMGRFLPEVSEDAMARSARVTMMFMDGFEPCMGQEALECGFQNTSGRAEVSCDQYDDERTAVLMTFGQSNSANAGRDRYMPFGDVANFSIHDGRCYVAEDPLLGPDGNGGAVWGVLADMLIKEGHYDRVLLVPFGIGGSGIGQWQADARFSPILERAVSATREAGIEPTHVLWHQGETDASQLTAEEDYFAMFAAIVDRLREGGVTAPVYPAVATHCEMSIFPVPPDRAVGVAQVRAAQLRLPELAGVQPGPDTDAIQGDQYRHDNCHFSHKGMRSHAQAWLTVITEP